MSEWGNRLGDEIMAAIRERQARSACYGATDPAAHVWTPLMVVDDSRQEACKRCGEVRNVTV